MNKPVYISPEVFDAIEDAMDSLSGAIISIEHEIEECEETSNTYKLCREGVERKRTRVAILKDFLVRHKQIL